MVTLRQAAQQALEALELPEGLNNHEERVLGKACAALRAALAEDALQRLTDVQQEMEAALAEQCQHGVTDGNCKECYVAEQEQQPVEWLTGCPECGMDGGCDCPSGTWNPPEQELVIDCPRCGHCCPQRKPLTDEFQIAEALRRYGLTLVKTAKGYEVMNLGQIISHGIGEKHE